MPSHTPKERAKRKKPFAGITKGAFRVNLRKKFGVALPKGKKIPAKLTARAKKLPPTSAKNKLIRKEANLAQVFASIRRKRKKK